VSLLICSFLHRTGGQPKGPNPQFREEFIFDAVGKCWVILQCLYVLLMSSGTAGEDAMFLVVEITRKSAMQAKGWETFLGQAVVPFDTVVKMYLDSLEPGIKHSFGVGSMPREVKSWFQLVDKTTGEQIGNSELQLSIQIGVNNTQ
jgi:hypothetical protein